MQPSQKQLLCFNSITESSPFFPSKQKCELESFTEVTSAWRWVTSSMPIRCIFRDKIVWRCLRCSSASLPVNLSVLSNVTFLTKNL
jgi:hypothetical protein